MGLGLVLRYEYGRAPGFGKAWIITGPRLELALGLE